MAEIKFYQDPAKEVQVYPEINPDGNYPGVTVGLADNLSSTDGIVDTDTWQYRSSGGELDISDGYAELNRLIGTTSSSTIEESLTYNLLTTGVTAITVSTSTFKTQISTTGTYNFIYTPTISYSSELVYALNKSTFANAMNKTTGTYTFTYTPVLAQVDTSSVISTFNSATFVSKVNETPDTYTFNYDGSHWKLTDSTHTSVTVTMSQYGITTTGSETSGDTIIIYYTSNSWYYNNAAVNMNTYGITTTGTETSGDTIVITYSSNDWQLDNSAVTLGNYGITITTGTPAIDDNIQIVYVAEQIGAIRVSNPTGLYSIGLNQFNKNGSYIMNGYTISSEGAITASSGSYVIYFKCLGNEVYTIYDENANAVVRAGFLANAPTTSSTVTILNTVSSSEWADSLVNDSTHKHYKSNANGYMCIATTDIEDLCCHLTWEAVNDDVYESYFDYTLPIPYKDEDQEVITTYGLANLDNTTTYYDEIDFVENKFYKRTDRIEYSAANLAEVQAMGVAYLYDSSWIYYGIETEVYTLPDISRAYKISNYGTEEFIGTSLPLTASIFYQDNLKDKLRFSCEVIDNKTSDILSNANNTYYPTTQAVLDLENMIWRMLGLDTTTFSTTKTYAVGDYVVYNHLLYKCITAVSTAGAWTGTNTVNYDDEDGIVSDVNTSILYSWMSGAYPSGTSYSYRLTANGDHTYSMYAVSSGGSTYNFASDAELEEIGITPTNIAGELTMYPSTGNWQESYLFSAN